MWLELACEMGAQYNPVRDNRGRRDCKKHPPDGSLNVSWSLTCESEMRPGEGCWGAVTWPTFRVVVSPPPELDRSVERRSRLLSCTQSTTAGLDVHIA